MIIKRNAQQSGNEMELKQLGVDVYIKPRAKVMNNGKNLDATPKGRKCLLLLSPFNLLLEVLATAGRQEKEKAYRGKRTP